MRGLDAFREAFAGMISRTVLRNSSAEVDPNRLCCSAGCGALINNLAYTLTEPGDAILVPSPYYPAFDSDLRAKVHARIVPVPTEEDDFRVTPSALTAGLARAAGRGLPRPKALLLTNPNNPTGHVYSEEDLIAILEWCLHHRIHLISDEIYANSVYSESGSRPFKSMTHILADQGHSVGDTRGAHELVHVLWGLSKDFGISGFRMGALYSGNEAVMKAMDSLGYFSAISNDSQERMSDVLSDDAFVESFLSLACRRLQENAAIVHEGAETLGVRVIGGDSMGGLFLWMDFRHWLPEATWEAEQALFDQFVSDAGVILTPGKACHAAEPGYFRCCFAWAEPEAIRAGFERLSTLRD